MERYVGHESGSPLIRKGYAEMIVTGPNATQRWKQK